MQARMTGLCTERNCDAGMVTVMRGGGGEWKDVLSFVMIRTHRKGGCDEVMTVLSSRGRIKGGAEW